MMRVRRDTRDSLVLLALSHGMKAGPFANLVIESIATCPPEKFHAAMSAFLDESRRR